MIVYCYKEFELVFKQTLNIFINKQPFISFKLLLGQNEIHSDLMSWPCVRLRVCVRVRVNFSLNIFFSETTTPRELIFGRNVPWVVLLCLWLDILCASTFLIEHIILPHHGCFNSIATWETNVNNYELYYNEKCQHPDWQFWELSNNLQCYLRF
jgi:hypothetical protein